MIDKIFKTPVQKHFAGVSAATFISRVLGYVRDVFIASFFGTTMFADAFFVAFRIPNLLRKLLGEGSLPAAFIPTYCETLAKGEKERGEKLAGNFFSLLAVISLLLVVLGIIFAPFIIKITAWGFRENPQKFFLTVSLARIMFPILLLVTLSTAAMGVLNARKIFFIPAIAPALFNVSLISFFLLLAGKDPLKNIRGLAFFAVAGFALHFLLMVPLLVRKKVSRLKYLVTGLFSNPDVKKVFVLLLPAVVGLSVMQLNIFVDTICASLLGEGMVSALYFANRVNQLPLALFGISISIVSLPLMSDSTARNDAEGVSLNLFSSLRSSYFLILPSTAGLIICAKEIVGLLFERGNFGAFSTNATASVLVFYAAGLFAFSGVKIFANFFYSMKDMKTPVIAASISFVINIFLDVILMFPMGISGLALATSAASVFNFSYLCFLILKSGTPAPAGFSAGMIKILVSTGVMTASLLAFPALHILIKIPAAAAVYLICSKVWGQVLH
ncbi:MAG: murein biosynthesis integral membrane protein MurJ [bacterium]